MEFGMFKNAWECLLNRWIHESINQSMTPSKHIDGQHSTALWTEILGVWCVTHPQGGQDSDDVAEGETPPPREESASRIPMLYSIPDQFGEPIVLRAFRNPTYSGYSLKP